MKACGRVDFLELGTSWRLVASFTHRPLYPQGKSPRYPLDRRLLIYTEGPQNIYISIEVIYGHNHRVEPNVVYRV
jgi:hypothetical protein